MFYTTVTVRYMCMYCIHKQQARNTIIHTYTLPVHRCRISLLHVGNFPDPIRNENVPLSFGYSVCLLLSEGTEPRGLGLSDLLIGLFSFG